MYIGIDTFSLKNFHKYKFKIAPLVEIAISKPALAPAITASKHPGCTVGSPSPKKPIAFMPSSAASFRNLIKFSVVIIFSPLLIDLIKRIL